MPTRFLFLVLALAACSSHTPVDSNASAILGDTFAVKVGQQVSFDREKLRIVFEAVSEDSRCPTDVTCVWAGNGRVRLRVITTESSVATDLNTTTEPRAAAVLGYQISLEQLEPYPVSSNRIPQDRYVAHLKVTLP